MPNEPIRTNDVNGQRDDLRTEILEAIDNIHVMGCNGAPIEDREAKIRMIEAAMMRGGIEEDEWELLDIAENATVLYEPCELEGNAVAANIPAGKSGGPGRA